VDRLGKQCWYVIGLPSCSICRSLTALSKLNMLYFNTLLRPLQQHLQTVACHLLSVPVPVPVLVTVLVPGGGNRGIKSILKIASPGSTINFPGIHFQISLSFSRELKMGGANTKEVKEEGVYAKITGTTKSIKVFIDSSSVETSTEQSDPDNTNNPQDEIHVLAKSLVLNALTHEQAPKQLGLILQQALLTETVKQQTRELVYWSLMTEDTVKNMQILAKWHTINYMQTLGTHQLRDLSVWWLKQPYTRDAVIGPLITWTIREPSICLYQSVWLIKETLPTAQVTNSCLSISF
jgi:hypothetical protein